MHTRKRKSDLPSKIGIGPITNNEGTQEKMYNANTLVHTLCTGFDLKDYTHIYATIHCKTVHQDNIMHNSLAVTILTQ